MIKVSVVIPAYNEEKLIERCLKSLVKQTMPRKEYEIIVVDNNSSDKTAEIARKYADRVIVEKRKGILFARQTGFLASEAEIILRTDSDGFVPKNWIKHGYTYLEKHKNIVAVSGYYLPDNNSELLEVTAKTMMEYKDLIFTTIGKTEWLTGTCSSFRKSAFEMAGGFNLNADPVIEDQQGIAHRISKHGIIAFDKQWWVWYSPRRTTLKKQGIKGLAKDYLVYQLLNNLYYFVFKKYPKKTMGKWKDIRE